MEKITDDPSAGLRSLNDPAVEQLIRELSEHLHDQYDPIVDLGMTRVRLDSTAWITVMENPTRPLAMQIQMARIPLWIFTVDDLIDQHVWTPKELSARLSVYERMLEGTFDGPRDALGNIWDDILTTLRGGPHFPLLGDQWRESFVRMLEAMRVESRADHCPQAFDTYMAGAEYSIGVPTYVLAS